MEAAVAAAVAAAPAVMEVVVAGAAAIGLLELVSNKVEQMTSNGPGARKEALEAARKEGKEAHENAMISIKKTWDDIDKASRAAENAASQRIKEETEANNKALKRMRSSIRAEEEKRDAQMKELEREHDRKMATLRTDTKESREAAEKEHLKKVGELEEKHEGEKVAALKKLDLVKVEGDKKVEQAMKERDAVMEQRRNDLKVYEDTMGKLMEANQNCVKKIMQLTNQLRIAGEEEKRLQIKTENELAMKQLEQCAMSLAAQFHADACKKLVRTFVDVMEPVLETKASLQRILAICSDGLDVESGSLTADFDVLKQVKSTFQHRVYSYHLLGNYHRVNPELQKTCDQFLLKLKAVIESQDLDIVIVNFPRAIDSKRQDLIEKYCDISKMLSDKIGEDPQAEIQNLLREVIDNHNKTAIQNQNLEQLE